MAQRFGARITLMSVVSPFWQAGSGDLSGAMVVDMDELKRDLETRLDGALRERVRGSDRGPGGGNRRSGGDHHALRAYPRRGPDHDADPWLWAISQPAAGFGDRQGLHDAQCPVWTATHMEEPPALHHVAGRNILCAVDATPQEFALMEWAAEYAKDYRRHAAAGPRGFGHSGMAGTPAGPGVRGNAAAAGTRNHREAAKIGGREDPCAWRWARSPERSAKKPSVTMPT